MNMTTLIHPGSGSANARCGGTLGVTRQAPVERAPRASAQHLWQRYHQSADALTENELVEHYLPLVAAVCGRLAMTLPDHADTDDLRSAGLIGLLQALRNFDPACGTSFETYARLRIRGAMLDELRRMDWVPRSVHQKARKLQEVMAQLEQALGRSPTDAEMARTLKMSLTEYRDRLDEVRPATFVCLDSVISSEEGDMGSVADIVGDGTPDSAAEQASKRELKAIILARLRELPEMQRKVLALYYGEDLRLREIAAAFGLTEARICQIHAQAILSIRSFIQRFDAGLAGNSLVARRNHVPAGAN